MERLSLASRLRLALANEELALHYQPVFAVRSWRLIGVEALLRWHDPDHGMIPPSTLIPVAEETELIEAIGEWVLRTACVQQVRWASQGLLLRVSVNVSPRQLRRADYCERVAAILEESRVAPSMITIEVTESATMQDAAVTGPLLNHIHRLGVRIALDDFGSGYSSLARLRELPVEVLKIDRAFLRDVPESAEGAAIVVAILRLARHWD